MNDYQIFLNGFSWTCEVRNENGEVVCHSVEDTPMEALKVAMVSEIDSDD